MRLLIAGGGTGGHIYPALAVARSLRDPRPTDRPELVWLGGHRGLEADLVRGAGIRVRRLALRSLRTVDLIVNTVLDPIRLGAVGARRPRRSSRAERPAAIFTTGGYVAIPALLAAAPLRIPVVLWEGNVDPRPRGPGDGPPRRRARRSPTRPTGRALAAAGVPTYVTGTPIRDVTAIDRADARARLDLPADAPVDPDLRRLAGRPPVQRRRRRGAAAARRAGPRPPRHGRRRLRRRARGAGAAARRRRARATGRTRSCARTCCAALVATDLVVGRAGSSTLAEVTALGIPSVIVPYPHAAGHQGANAATLADAGAARIVPDEAFDADALVAATDLLVRATPPARRWPRRPGASAGPEPPTPSPR